MKTILLILGLFICDRAPGQTISTFILLAHSYLKITHSERNCASRFPRAALYLICGDPRELHFLSLKQQHTGGKQLHWQ